MPDPSDWPRLAEFVAAGFSPDDIARDVIDGLREVAGRLGRRTPLVKVPTSALIRTLKDYFSHDVFTPDAVWVLTSSGKQRYNDPRISRVTELPTKNKGGRKRVHDREPIWIAAFRRANSPDGLHPDDFEDFRKAARAFYLDASDTWVHDECQKVFDLLVSRKPSF